jgi:hypothetical protein
MTARRLLLVTLGPVLAACAGAPKPAAATTTPTTTTPTPALAGAMQPLGFYVGQWSCKGTELDAAGNAVAAEALGIRVTPRLDGSWLEVVVLVDGAAVTHELKGYSTADRKFHHLWAVGEGAWGSLTSDGWNGAQMVFVDDRPAPGAPAERMVFTKDTDTHYTHRAEVADAGADGGWRATYTKDCVKQG